MGSDLNTSLARKRGVIKEFLVTGKEVTAQLQMLMKKPCWRSDENKHLVDELMGKIMSSYDQSLLVLKSDADEVFHQDLMTNSHHVSNGFDNEGRGRGYEVSSESKKIPAVKDKRGCYKRRKSGDTWARVSPTTDDEYAWRKYGQKAILNCKYPRSYFRCTHKYDQGCKATKQVQRMEDTPDQYHTTYIGVHTCKEITKAPLMISDSSDQKHLESILVFSQTSSKIPKPQQQQQHHYIKPFPNPTTSSTTFIKEEGKEDTNSDLTDNNNVSSMDSYMPNEFMSIESAEPTTITSRIMGGDEYDVPHWISNVDDDFFEAYFSNNNM